MYYDAPSIDQQTKLMATCGNDVINHLVSWGCGKVEKGDTVGLTHGLWTKGRFSEFIEAALDDKLTAERMIIHAMAIDFVRDHQTV